MRDLYFNHLLNCCHRSLKVWSMIKSTQKTAISLWSPVMNMTLHLFYVTQKRWISKNLSPISAQNVYTHKFRICRLIGNIQFWTRKSNRSSHSSICLHSFSLDPQTSDDLSHMFQLFTRRLELSMKFSYSENQWKFFEQWNWWLIFAGYLDSFIFCIQSNWVKLIVVESNSGDIEITKTWSS